MSDKSASWEKWENTRAKGRWSYILKYGVVYWGVTTGVCFSLISHWLNDDHAGEHALGPLPWFLNIIIFCIVGIAWGASTWTLAEKRYARFKSTSHDEE